jgi:SAM-dependent methyltransferase
MSPFISKRLKKSVPWFVKIPAKIVLSRLPVRSLQWQRLNVFRAGTMDTPGEAFLTFKKHFEATGLASLRGCTVLELGPGNSGLSALFAASFGAARTWLVDAEPLASQDVTLFGRAEQILSEANLPVHGAGAEPSMDAALRLLNAVYLTEGLASLQTIPDAEVDFLFSNAVLEHIRLADFGKTVKEMRRVLKPTGAVSHQIDFRDHLQYSLNNLRFSERIWESRFMADSGFYTNRLTWRAMEKLFQEAGFAVRLQSFDLWPNGLPTRQSIMALPFKNMSPDELMVREAHVVLQPLV